MADKKDIPKEVRDYFAELGRKSKGGGRPALDEFEMTEKQKRKRAANERYRIEKELLLDWQVSGDGTHRAKRGEYRYEISTEERLDGRYQLFVNEEYINENDRIIRLKQIADNIAKNMEKTEV